MTFSKQLGVIQRMLGRAGYHTLREPIDTEKIGDSMIDCEIMARNDQYNILYMEAESKWRELAKGVAESQDTSCLVVTKHGDALIMSTIQDKLSRTPKIRHVVIQPDSEKYGLQDFINRIKATIADDHITIDERVQKTFDDYTKYDEAIKKFGENLGDVISDTKDLISKKTKSNSYRKEAKKFAALCNDILNDTIDETSVTNMLIQHVITSRIFAMIYDYDFYQTNSIAIELEKLRKLIKIPDDIIDYSEIKLVAESITDNESRQDFIRNIYETFYKKFDPKRADRDGIVYTPIEIVDFILNSVNYILETEFDAKFSDREVKVLDPFSGTGTFLARLMTSGMLEPNLLSKYKEDLYANELLLLAFYIATINIESTFASLYSKYHSFEGMNYTDTLAMNPRYLEGGHHAQEETKLDKFPEIKKRRQKQRKTNLHVIVGNPPYSAGQTSFNDQNQNVSYPEIENRIESTYLTKTKSINPKIGLTRSLYDSYIRSIRWASDRIGESGIIGFVTNGSFIRTEAAAGVRACFQEEFTDVWVFDLLGKKGMQGHGRNVFEYPGVSSGGTTTQIAIIVLVKNPAKKKHTIHYSSLTKEDYSGPDKRARVKELGSIKGIQDWQTITPDKHHDWLNQRTSEFQNYLPMGSKDAKAGKGHAVFEIYSAGVATSRDVWVYNSSKKELSKNMKRHIDYCNEQDLDNPIMDPKQAKWSGELSADLKRYGKQKFSKNKIRTALYRPFFKQYTYFDPQVYSHRVYQIPKLFPENDSENLAISVPHKGIGEKFSTLITDDTPDLHLIEQSQCFPLKTKKDSGMREREPRNLCIIVPNKIQREFSVFITDVTPDLEVIHHGQVFPLKVME